MVSPAVTSTATWDGVYTRHAHNFVGESGFKDNFYNERPLLRALRAKGLSASGGQQIVHRISTGSAAVGGFGAKGKRYDLTDVDPFTALRYDWRYALEPIIMYHADEHQAGNAPEARMSLVEDKTADAGQRLRDLLIDKLCAETKAGTEDPNTILQFIRPDPDAADTDLMGGISAATHSFWRNQANEAATDFSAVGEKAMRDLRNDCSRGGTPVTKLWVLPQEFQSQYVDLISAKHSVNVNPTSGAGRAADVAADGGGVMYDGAEVIWDLAWDNATHADVYGVAIDTMGLHLVEDKAEAFAVEPFEKTLVGGVDARVGWIRWTGNLTCSERRTQGMFADLD